MLIGYVRVSTNEQNTALQRNALESAGCELIFDDKASGKKAERPGLKKVFRMLSRGAPLVVWKLAKHAVTPHPVRAGFYGALNKTLLFRE